MKQETSDKSIKIALIVGAFFFFLTEVFQATKVTSSLFDLISNFLSQLYSSTGLLLFVVLALLTFLYAVLGVAFWHHRRSSKKRVAELESFGLITVNERAEEGIISSLSEPKASFFWHGYSSVNVVSHVDHEKIIRNKGSSGVDYHFNLLDPTSTFGCLLHAKHEQNNDDQGRGYIHRALSVIGEMEKDSISVAHSHYYLPPIFRLVNIDNDKLQVGIYPAGDCGIDSREVVLSRSESSPLYDFFTYFVQRYTEIGEYLRVRDVAFSAIMKSFVTKEQMPFVIDGLHIAAADSDHMRIVRAELLDILDKSEGVQLRWIPKSGNNGSLAMAAEHILNPSLGQSIKDYRSAVRSISQGLKSLPEFQTMDASFASAGLGLDAAAVVKAVKIPAKGEGGKRRAYSGWLAHAVFNSLKQNGRDAPETSLGIINEDQIQEVTQFGFKSEISELLSWGPEAERVLQDAMTAAKSFDPNSFDDDGYAV